MKIKMITLAAGPDGVKQPGKVYDVNEAEAKELVDGRYAEYVGILPVETPGPVDNSYDAESGELIGYCSVVPEIEGEEHIFGETLYVFVKEEDGKLFFTKLETQLPTLEVFADLKADEQKSLLSGLQIEGDDGNPEKRTALYAAYLVTKSAPDEE